MPNLKKRCYAATMCINTVLFVVDI